MVAAFGDAGHAFPAIALARELHARGHRVLVETWAQWRQAVEAEGLEFTAAQEYVVYPPPGPDSSDGRTAADAARALARLMDEFKPDLVVSDILTLAPALAAEVAGVRRATLIPHLYPVQEPGMPLWSLGFRPPRGRLGRAAWRLPLPLIWAGLRQGRDELNVTRVRLGLAPLDRFHGGISERLAIVATFPQLEYPREWPAHVQVTGPLFFELPSEDVELPAGEGPLVLVAPSTVQDPECTLLRAALDGLAEAPVRVLATTNRHRPAEPIRVPANAVLHPWLSYRQAMEVADVAISHGGHGTLARALDAGVPVLASPALGDMAENGARVSWAGCGLMVPRRLLSPGSIRTAVRELLADRRYAVRAAEIGAWSAANQGAARAADLVEQAAGGETERAGSRRPSSASVL
jgi:UDP:flavonoid glycosyltransferase YjiC (YdhE family)